MDVQHVKRGRKNKLNVCVEGMMNNGLPQRAMWQKEIL